MDVLAHLPGHQVWGSATVSHMSSQVTDSIGHKHEAFTIPPFVEKL